jgi:Tol biopolymer transport system component
MRSTDVAACLAAAVTLAACASASATTTSTTIGQVTWVKGGGVTYNSDPLQPKGTQDTWTANVQTLHARDVLSVASGKGFSYVQFVVRTMVGSAMSKTFCGAGLYGRLNTVQLEPANGVLVGVPKGSMICGTGKPPSQKQFRAGTKNQALATTNDPIFQITANGVKSVLTVQRGTVLVSSTGSKTAPVIVGKSQQTVVGKAGAPTGPKTSPKPTAAQQRQVQNLQKVAPQSTDTVKPQTGITGVTGAHQPGSSLRFATFTFQTDDPTAITSCALDSDDFRVCSKSATFSQLLPGPHVFRVRATDPAGNVGVPAQYAWTVDGSKILFESTRDGNPEVYSMETDGTAQTDLSNNPFADADPAWSPNRKQIAFQSNREGGAIAAPDIYVMNADGSGQTRLTLNPTFDRNPAWSPDGSSIVFQSDRDGNEELYVLSVADPGKVTRLTFDRGVDQDPAWSPDGSRIAFASDRSGSLQIYTMNPDGSGVTRLTFDGSTDFNPAWSPDGTRIAFNTKADGFSAIWTMNPDGTGLTKVTNPPSYDDYNPTWAPDGQEIAYQSDHNDGHGTQIYVVNADGSGEPTRLTDAPGDNLVPNWSSG